MLGRTPVDCHTDKLVDVVIVRDGHQVLHVVLIDNLLRMPLPGHNILERVVAEVEDVWEVEVRVDLFIHKGVKVKDNPLQVHNQHIRWLGYQLPLLHIDLLIAVLALEVIDNRALNHLLKTVGETPSVFYGQTQVIVALKDVSDIPARLTYQLRACITPKDALKQVFLGRWLQTVFDLGEKEIQEFLSILLQRSISRITIEILEGESESEGIKCLLLGEF
jgi:hypothetical protein